MMILEVEENNNREKSIEDKNIDNYSENRGLELKGTRFFTEKTHEK